MPTFEILCECLTREKSKLMYLDALSIPMNHVLVQHTSEGKHKVFF